MKTKERAAADAPAWGWRRKDAGRVPLVRTVQEGITTTVTAARLFPFNTGAGAPKEGVPWGPHLLWGEIVCVSPFDWLKAGYITSLNVFMEAEPGVGKSGACKRQMRAEAARGVKSLVLGDSRPDYNEVVEDMGGQVIRVGRGMDRFNPLDPGPFAQILPRLPEETAKQVRMEIRARQVTAMMAQITLKRRGEVRNVEEAVVGAALDLLNARALERGHVLAEPTVPELLDIIAETDPDETLIKAAQCYTRTEYRREVKELRQTLSALLGGTMAGMFDGPTTQHFDLDAPAITVDISRIAAAGDDLLASTLVAIYSYGFACIEAAGLAAQMGLAKPQPFMVVLDEFWNSMRNAPGIVKRIDSMMRLLRTAEVSIWMVVHSMDDLEALATEQDRAMARGFIDRSAIVVLGGLSPRELDRVGQVVHLTRPERALISGWAGAESWVKGSKHPGRGKFMVKIGQKVGLPVQIRLVADEEDLYDTDPKVA